MFKKPYHPKSFLTSIRNLRPGLVARTRIVSRLEKVASDTKSLINYASLSYSGVLHHLHLLENEDIVVRNDKKPYIWELTGVGQQRLKLR
jgi:hypothetical protein